MGCARELAAPGARVGCARARITPRAQRTAYTCNLKCLDAKPLTSGGASACMDACSEPLQKASERVGAVFSEAEVSTRAVE